MERSVVQGHLHGFHWITSKHAVLQRCLEAFLNWSYEFLWNGSTFDRVNELQTGLFRVGLWLNTHVYISKLTATTSLLLVQLTVFDRTSDGLFVFHLRRTLVALYLEFALHAIHKDLQVQFAHSADHGLASILVGVNFECWILLGQFAQSSSHLIQVRLGLWFNGNSNYRLWEAHALQNDRVRLRTKCISGSDIFETNGCSNISCFNTLHRILLVGVHLENTTDAFFLITPRIQYITSSIQVSAIGAEECQTTYEGVSCDLECQCRERLIRIRVTLDLCIRARVNADHGLNVHRAWQISHDRIKHGLYPFILESATTKDRRNAHVNSADADRIHDLSLSKAIWIIEILLH